MSAITRRAPAALSTLAAAVLAAAPALSLDRGAVLPFGFEALVRPTSDQYLAVSSADFGIALAQDGDTLAVGTRGSICIFVRAGNAWSLQQTLRDGVATGSHFGEEIAVSGDTLVAGANATDVGGLGGAAYVYVRSGGVWSLQQTLVGQGGWGFSEFGAAVAVEGDTLLVGAPRDVETSGGHVAGAAYVFARTGSAWSEVQRLEAPDGTRGLFGQTVALSGNTAAIGAPFRDGAAGNASGAVFVFTRSGALWTHQQTLEGSDSAAQDQFGSALDADGERIVAGSTSTGANEEGAAYVFVRSGTVWSEEQKIAGAPPGAFDRCGDEVAIEGNTILMSCISREAYAFARSGSTWTRQALLGTTGEPPGNAVALDGNDAIVGAWFIETGIPPMQTMGPDIVTLFASSAGTWSAQSRLFNPDAPSMDGFATSLAAEGDLLAVGAPYDATAVAVQRGSVTLHSRAAGTWTRLAKLAPASPAESGLGASVALAGPMLIAGATGLPGDPGRAIVFEGAGGTWAPTATLTPQDSQPNDSFGSAVALAGSTVVVGARTAGAGAAYPFVGSGAAWSPQGKLVAPDGAVGDQFGGAVAVSGDTIVVGSYADLPGLDIAGAAYVFVRSGATWSFAQKLTAPDAAANAVFGASLAMAGSELFVGAPGAGAVYAFVRSGGTWTFAQRLAADGGGFGRALAFDGDLLAVGANQLDLATPSGFPEGAVYVFERAGGWVQTQRLTAPTTGLGSTLALDAPLLAAQGGINDGLVGLFRQGPAADLALSLSAPASAVAGESIGLSVIVANQGPAGVSDARVTDLLSPPLASATWTCTASAGSACSATGSGALDDTVTIAPGGMLTYAVAAQVRSDAMGAFSTTATVAPAAGILDPDPLDDTASATIAVTRRADVSMDKTDGRLRVAPGAPLSYALTVRNAGPSRSRVFVSDTFPAAYTGATWTCAADPGAVCHSVGGSGDLSSAQGTLRPGLSVTFTTNGTVSPSATGTLSNTATVGAEIGIDPAAANNSDTDLDLISLAAAELTPGAAALDSFAVPSPHYFWIAQQPFASYEIVVDARSGNLGSLALDRLGANASTVLQSSAGTSGIGVSRSLRFLNDRSIVVDHELVRVASAACSTGCGASDGYRVRAYETTGRIARFNNSGSQASVVILQNTAAAPLTGTVYFWGPDGAPRARSPFSLDPRAVAVIGTGGIAALQGTSGSITVGHDGPYGSLVGKAVSLEPATGFSFDSNLEPVRR